MTDKDKINVEDSILLKDILADKADIVEIKDIKIEVIPEGTQEERKLIKRIKVGAESNMHKVATSVAMCIQENQGHLEVSAIGAKAVNQAVKGIINANAILALKGKLIRTFMGFEDIILSDGREVSSILFRLET